MRRLAVFCVAAAFSAAVFAAEPVPDFVAKAIADPSRPAGQRAADATRKPAETIAFAGVKPGMIVGEFYPGGGYFTRMLSIAVGPSGHVYGIENDRWKSAVKADTELAAQGQLKNVSMEAAPFGTVRFPQPHYNNQSSEQTKKW